mgnify:CR=1 FL=1
MNSKEILQSIINDFDINKFELFFRQKNDKLRFFYEDLNIKAGDNFNDFKECKKIAEGKLDDGKLIICSLLVSRALKERSGKKLQYDLGKQILKQENSDAGIFIFYDENGNFRFSLIYTNYLGKKRDFSSFKRFTYFVSKDQTNKTFLKQIGEGDLSTIEKIKEAFSVEKVTKEFYTEIANWYFWAIDNSYFPEAVEKEENGRNMAIIKLITRLIFIWFMREENLVPKELFDKNKLKLIINDIDPDSSSYYLAILQNLFFATLNTKKEERQFRTEVRGLKGYNPDFGNQFVFRHHSYFINPEKIKDYFSNIPFLNGGLFECLDEGEKNKYIDGFTERKSYQPKVPNRLFFSEGEMINLNKYYGTENKRYEVKGIFNILSSFNFTIDENSSDDADIALDPELLGRVFENLLASFNPETATTARKATGSYYTPRGIVDYMVEESLRQYFKSNLTDIENIDEKLENLFSIENDKNPFNDNESKRVVKLIENVRIVDPAVGSGAFPMGELNKMVFILNKIDPKNELWKQAQIEVAELIPDAEVRNNTINQIENYFTTKKPDYFRKLYLIQKCIFGVDIQQIAVEISKLRFFISLLVDEDKDDIQPLPNLDFKIMQGNSLIEFVSYMQKNDDKWNAMVNQITTLKEHLFNTYDHNEKNKIREEINKLIIELFNYDNNAEIEQMKKKIANIQSSQRLFDDGQGKREDSKEIEKIKEEIKEKRKNIMKDFKLTEQHFEWHINFAEVFKEKDGFDIVIGNPPYIGEKGHRELFKEIKKSPLGQYYEGKMDYFYFFFHLALNISKNDGIVAFITTNYYLTATGAKKLRQDFKERAIIKKVINFNELKIFESATGQHNMITILQKCRDENAVAETCITKRKEFANTEIIKQILSKEDKETQYYEVCQKNLYDGEENYIRLNGVGNSDVIGDPIQKILDKIKNKGIKLGEICNINTGLYTAADDIFIFEEDKINSIFKNLNDIEVNLFKPFFKNSDIKKYYTSLTIKKKVLYHYEKADYKLNDIPNIISYLSNFKNKLEKRKDNSLKGALKRGRWDVMSLPKTSIDFEGAKIVAPQRSPRNTFGYNEIPWYASADVYFITEKDKSISLKYILALLNSKLYYVWLYYRGKKKGEILELYQKPLSEIPVKKISENDQKLFIEIVDKILAITKDEDYLQNPEKQTKVKEYERQIDQLVYQLYSLTPEEIEIVEQSANKN